MTHSPVLKSEEIHLCFSPFVNAVIAKRACVKCVSFDKSVIFEALNFLDTEILTLLLA